MKRDAGKKTPNTTGADTELARDTKKTPQWTLQKPSKNPAIFIIKKFFVNEKANSAQSSFKSPDYLTSVWLLAQNSHIQ